MIKYVLARNAEILFVGINPHYGSYRRGVPFSNNKTFWYLLNRAGIIDEEMDSLRADESLKRIYQNKFRQIYKLSFTNIITRPSRDVSQLKRGEEKSGNKRVLKLVLKLKPKVVCFIGKITYSKFVGNNDFDFGWQRNINGSKVYVIHFPIRGLAQVRIKELKKVKRVAIDA